MKRLIFTVVLLAFFTGCTPPQESIQSQIKRGEMRHKLFSECMELAAKNSRAADDDVSNVIDSCDSTSYHLSNSYVFIDETSPLKGNK